MLSAAGAEVQVLGFRRDDEIIEEIQDAGIVDLGRTYDNKLVHRALMVLRKLLHPKSWGQGVRDVDVLLARNLETLALAARARRKYAPNARLAYECLDIHRLLLSDRLSGICLRWIERALLRRVNLLLVSAPAFMSEYFEPRQGVNRNLRLPALLVENKILQPLSLRDRDDPAASAPPPGPPWRIGWFGMIRCRSSLDALCELAARRPQLLQVVIRGRPAQVEFDDFDAQVSHTPGVTFGGPYRPAELESLYRNVHFNWAIDYFEEGANSSWLLPNRLYEGGFYDAVPIALAGTETGRFLKRLGLGVLLDSAGSGLEEFLLNLTPARYDELKRASCAAPRSLFAADNRDFARLLEGLIEDPPPSGGECAPMGLREHPLGATEQHGFLNRV
jgi:hypothetical protein